MRKLLIAALTGASALPALAETICSGESVEVKLDLATGTMRTPAATETLTYSTEWDGGSDVTLAVNSATLASGLTGSGTYDWTPSGEGLFTLTHTTTTSSGDVVLTATFMTPPKYVAPAYVDNIASNGIAYWTTNTVPNGYTVVESAASRVTWGTAGETSWYVVTNGTFQIDGGVQCKGNVHLVLCDGAKLTVTNVADRKAGIATDASGSFTIYGTPEGAGELSATAGRWYGAGIGGNDGEDGSHITINGGTVTATGGSCGAGIGGGMWASGTDIVINGGVVYAKCIATDGGAGIGGGHNDDIGVVCSGIVINGGVVYAEGGWGSAAIGGGYWAKGSDIAINGGKVSVYTIQSMLYSGEVEYAYPGDFIGSGTLADAAENVSIADSANVCFNLTGIYDGGRTYTWIEGPAPSPKDFDGFVIMTPSTQRVDLVLVGGISAFNPQLSTFSLTNAATGATGSIEVNGADVMFANKLLSLPHADSKLTLNAYEYSTIGDPTEVDRTTAKVYTNAVEDATLIETPIVVRKDSAAYVVYTAADGYVFADGTTAKTNTIDTSVNPATAESPAAPTFAVAKIVETGVYYAMVQTAFDAAADGQTVQLLTNATESVTLEAADKTNALDLAGWVLKGDGTASVIQVVEGNLTISDSNPASVHYYKVDTNGVWVWQAEFSGTENYTFSIADGLQANGAATDDIPTTNDVIAVKGGAITGGSGTPEGTTTYGGGICVLENGALTVNGGTIVGNRIAGNYVAGGGIYIHGKNGGQYTLTSCALVGNVGGGLYGDYGAYALTSCQASYNRAGLGGGVYLRENGTAVIKGVKIIGNDATSSVGGSGEALRGGGVYALGALVLSDCVIRGNSASAGGGLDIWKTAAITNCIVANNTAAGSAGGIAVLNAGSITVKGGEISGNTTIGDGGGMYVSSAELGGSATIGCKATLIDVVLSGNSAANGGAVCQADTSELLMLGCTVTNNTATTSGGGICKLGDDYTGTVAGKCVLIDTEITGNTSGENGGGVYYRNATCLAAGTRVTMADGTAKAIEDVKEGDFVLTFDHEGGTNSTALVYLAYKGETKETPFTLWFDNGSSLSIVGRHDLLEQGSRKYVTITEANVGQYIGAKFYGEDGAWHTLMNATMGTAAVEFYSIYTTPDRNVFANGLLTVADDADFLLNLYALDENLKADPDQLAADIAKYGLYSYEESQEKFPGASRALYEALNGKYFKAAVGKQLVSWAYLQKTFTSVFRPTSSVSLPTSNVPRLTSLAAAPKLTSVTTEPALDDFDVGVLTLGAGAVITNNTANGAKSNIHLVTASSGADSLIKLASSHDGICAGVSCSWGVGQFTTNVNVSASDAALFTSDNPVYRVKFVADHLELSYLDITFTPTAVDHTTAAVYVNDLPVEKTGDAYVITSNVTATVVYTAEGEYVFAGGKKAVTNELDTAVDPATVKGVLPKVLDPVEYVAPAYVDNIASNGIAYWTTNMLYNYTVVTSAAERVTWGESGATSWYVVFNGDVQIDGGIVCTGDVHLVLCDCAKLTVTNVANSCAGIATDASGSFAIYETAPGDAASSPRPVGILDVTGDGYAAGIGGNFDVEGLNITINGGIVTARTGEADEAGAGIGGGSFAGGSNITINGGTVTATCSDMGAGIGGGYDSDGSGITINGGTVTARGGLYAAGVGGGGEGGRGSHITVNGGTVTATGGEGAAGIGGGSESVGSNIAIRGGTVTAIGGLTSPGIGGGGEGAGENVRIANAIVFVGTMDAIIDEGEGPCRYSADLIGGGGLAGDPSSDIVIDETAQVFFNLTGAWDYNNEVWIEESAPMPENFEGFVIMTPATQTVDRVLIGGCGVSGVSALPAFTLRKVEQERTKEIEIDGESVPFANVMLTLTNDVTGNGVLKLTVSELPTDPVVQDKSGNDVEIEVPQTWREEKGVKDEDVVDTVNTNDNGMVTWQSYVLGLDPTNKLSVIYADTPQNTNETTVTIETKNIDEAKVADGYGLQYRLEKTEGGMETKTQKTPSFDVDVTGDDPTGHYQLSVVIAKTNSEGEVTQVLDQTAEAINTVGMVKQTQAATNAIVSVPWGRLAPGLMQEIAVSNVVKTANLDEGDELRVYRPGKSEYESWKLNVDKVWEKVTNIKITSNSLKPKLTTAGAPDEATIPRGSGIWLCRKGPNKDKPYYLYGQSNGEENDVELVKGANLIGATGIGAYDINEHVTGAVTGDKIVIPGTNDVPKVVTLGNDGKWGYWTSVPGKSYTFGGKTYQSYQTVWTNEVTVAPGTGFWLHNKSGKIEVK